MGRGVFGFNQLMNPWRCEFTKASWPSQSKKGLRFSDIVERQRVEKAKTSSSAAR